MIQIRLKKSIDEYILRYIVVAEDKVPYNTGKSYGTKATDKNFSQYDIYKLEQVISEAGDTFQDKLFELIDKSGMTDVEVYKRANIDRKLFSKIRSNPTYHTRKQTVLALAIALRLSIDETIDLLMSAGYAFSLGNKGDLIVRYFIENEIFDIMTVNSALDEYEQPILA